jgi:hypothetical protein
MATTHGYYSELLTHEALQRFSKTLQALIASWRKEHVHTRGVILIDHFTKEPREFVPINSTRAKEIRHLLSRSSTSNIVFTG